MAGRNTVEIVLSAQDKASGPIKAAFNTLERTSSKAMDAIKVGAGIAIGAMATLAGVVGKVGIQYNAMMEQSQIAWATILGDQQEAIKTMRTLQEMGANTPFEFEGLDKAAKLLNMAGFAGDELFDTITKVGDAVSAVGGNDEVLNGVAMAIFQISTKGKISAQEMNQLAERGIPAWQMLADGMNLSVQEVMKLSENGKLFAKEALPLIVDGMGNRFKGSMEAQSKTFNGMVSAMKDNLKMISAELTKPLFEKLTAGLTMVMPYVTAFKDTLREDGIGEALKNLFPPGIQAVFTAIGKGFAWIKDGVKSLVGITKGEGGSMDWLIKYFGLDNAVAVHDFLHGIMDGFKRIQEGIAWVKEGFNVVKGIIDGSGSMDWLIKNFGLEKAKDIYQFVRDMMDKFEQVKKVVSEVFYNLSSIIGGYIEYVKGVFSGEGDLGGTFLKIFNTIKSIAVPILAEIVAWIGEKITQIKQFWEENGAQIIQAVKNLWSVIAAIFKFIAPVILVVLKMLWDSVRGIIDGALKVIMGLVKVFAGLFTGDFGKMWEGIKQIFFGAIQAVWNWLNLLFIGRILGGIKAFVTSGVGHVTGFWTKTVEVFKNLDTHVWNIVSSMVSKVVAWFKGFVDEGVRIFGTLRTFGVQRFEALKEAIFTIVRNMVNAVKNFFGDLVTGAKFHFDGLLSKAKSIFSAVKDAITNPVETAKETVRKAIEAIKGFFGNMTSKIKMPHFSISWNTVSAFGKDIRYPTGFDVDWYDKGGVFYGPQIIGVGEKRPEFVGALDDLRQIVREESGGSRQQSANNTPQYLVLNIDGREFMLAVIDQIQEEMNFREKRWA